MSEKGSGRMKRGLTDPVPPLWVLCRGLGFAYGGVQTAVSNLVDELRGSGVDVRLVTRSASEKTDVWCDGAVWTWNRKRLEWWRAHLQGLAEMGLVETPDPSAVLAVRS